MKFLLCWVCNCSSSYPGEGISLLLRCLLCERKLDCERGGLLYKGRDNKHVKSIVKVAICCDVM
jgi:hypothetical protein